MDIFMFYWLVFNCLLIIYSNDELIFHTLTSVVLSGKHLLQLENKLVRAYSTILTFLLKIAHLNLANTLSHQGCVCSVSVCYVSPRMRV